jgi:hypothetical protein
LADGPYIDKDFVRKKAVCFVGKIGSQYPIPFQLVVQKPLQGLAKEKAAQIDQNIHSPLCGVTFHIPPGKTLIQFKRFVEANRDSAKIRVLVIPNEIIKISVLGH